MRKKQLMKQAEHIAAVRAKAQAATAAKDGASTPTAVATLPIPTSATTPALPTSGSQDSLPPPKSSSQPALTGPTPLHPSLPAKPDTTPVPEVVPLPVRMATPNPPPAVPSPTPVPTVASPAPAPTPAEPASLDLPPDDQIKKFEEVRVLVSFGTQHASCSPAKRLGYDSTLRCEGSCKVHGPPESVACTEGLCVHFLCRMFVAFGHAAPSNLSRRSKITDVKRAAACPTCATQVLAVTSPSESSGRTHGRSCYETWSQGSRGQHTIH